MPPRRFCGLVVLVFFVIFLVLVFGLLIQSCASQSRHSAYADYIGKVGTIAQQSTQRRQGHRHGADHPGADGRRRSSRSCRASRAVEQQNVVAAQSLDPPGRLRTENADLVEALQLRVSGVDGLATAFQQTLGAKVKTSEEAVLLSQQAYRLLASDIVWEDLFEAPTADQLQRYDIRDVVPPASTFLADPDLIITQHAMTLLVERIEGATSTGSSGQQACPTNLLHGTNIVSVSALPNGPGGSVETLTTGSLNTISTSTSLVFQVTIADGGSFQEVGIPITLTINRPRRRAARSRRRRRSS